MTDDLIRRIARTVHYANVGWNFGLEDPAPDPVFDILPEWQQQFLLDRVNLIIDGYGPEAIHEHWVDVMSARGWVLGDVKNPAGDPPTHPCLKEWRLCSPEHQVKDTMAVGIVRNLMGVEQEIALRELVKLTEELGLYGDTSP